MTKTTSLLVAGALFVAACGGGDDGATAENVWARATVEGAPAGAIYFDLTVEEDDRLIGASVPTDVSASAEIHEVVMAERDVSPETEEMSGDMDDMDDAEMSAGSDDMDDMDDAEMPAGSDDMGDMEMSGEMGAMVIRELADGLALTGGETVSFEPGGYHVMLPALTDQLEVGEEFELTLDFETADDLTVTVEVAETAP